MQIGEVAQRSGISSRMLRHYDRLGVVSPSERTAGGYRHYTEADLRQLFPVEALRSLGLSLKEIAEVLDGPDFVPIPLVARLVERSRDRIAREQELLRTLEQVQVSEPDDWTNGLRTVGLLRGLEASSPSARQRLALSTAWTEVRDVPARHIDLYDRTDLIPFDKIRFLCAPTRSRARVRRLIGQLS